MDHVYLGCTQRECQTSKDVVDNYRSMFESKSSAVPVEKLPSPGKLGANISSWSYDMEGHAKKCVERYCELANKTTQHLYKVATPCMDDHQFEEEENGICWRIDKNLFTDCSEMLVFGSYLIDLIFFWSVNKLARAITKWTRPCDKRLARLISYIDHTSYYRQHCLVGNTARQCRLGLFQDSDFVGDLDNSKSTSG